MALIRLGAVRTVATALRTATRPGSAGVGERLASLPRLLRATATGEYAGASRGRLLLVVGAVAYLVSPLDFMTDAVLPLIGFADDAVIASWVAATLVNETEAFLQWERGSRTVVPGEVVP